MYRPQPDEFPPFYAGYIQAVNDDVITMPCKHSYKTLVKIMDYLNEFKTNKANNSKSSNFKAWG